MLPDYKSFFINWSILYTHNIEFQQKIFNTNYLDRFLNFYFSNCFCNEFNKSIINSRFFWVTWFHSDCFLLFFFDYILSMEFMYLFVEPSIETNSIVLIHICIIYTYIVHMHVLYTCKICSTNLTQNTSVVIIWHHRIYAYNT